MAMIVVVVRSGGLPGETEVSGETRREGEKGREKKKGWRSRAVRKVISVVTMFRSREKRLSHQMYVVAYSWNR